MATLRAPLIRLIDSRLDKNSTSVIGTSTSDAYQWFDSNLHHWIWVMNVDISGDGNRPDTGNILKAVPIADGAYGVHKLGPGARLRLARSNGRRTYEIVGTSMFIPASVTVLSVTYDELQITVGTTETFGSTWRPLTYTELGDSALNGGYTYGTLPYGVLGKFDLDGNLLFLLVP